MHHWIKCLIVSLPQDERVGNLGSLPPHEVNISLSLIVLVRWSKGPRHVGVSLQMVHLWKVVPLEVRLQSLWQVNWADVSTQSLDKGFPLIIVVPPSDPRFERLDGDAEHVAPDLLSCFLLQPIHFPRVHILPIKRRRDMDEMTVCNEKTLLTIT